MFNTLVAFAEAYCLYRAFHWQRGIDRIVNRILDRRARP